MSSSTASLVLSSLAPKTLSLCNPKSNFLPVNSSHFSSLRISSNPISVSASAVHPARESSFGLSSRFARKVAISSDYDQDQEVFGGRDEPRFSPDLKLFVGNLPFSADSAQLAELFESAGNVEMVEVIYDKITGRSRGFGFVTMSTVNEAQAAAQQFNGYELDGRSLRVNYGPPPARREEESSFRGARGGSNFGARGSGSNFGGRGGGSNFDNPNRLHVGNLAWGVDNLALETLFNEQGKVVEAKVVYDRESGRSRGFGFVTYNTAEEVDSAIEALNGVDLNGRAIRVTQAEARQRRQF